MESRTRRTGAADAGPLPHLTIAQLSYLVAVDESDTFADAARRVGVSTSALSQGLAELERRLGLALFERAGRRQILRADALPVVEYARRVIAQTRELGRWTEAALTGRVGSVRVGMIDGAAVEHFPARMAAFRRMRPEVELHLVVAPSGELLDRLSRGWLDLAVVVEPGRPPADLEFSELLTEELVVVAPEGRPIGEPASWGPWVLFPSGSHTRAIIERELSARGTRLDVVAESNQPEVLREMARLGVGWTVLPLGQAERAGANRSRRSRQEFTRIGVRRLMLARRIDRGHDAVIEAFEETLTATQ